MLPIMRTNGADYLLMALDGGAWGRARLGLDIAQSLAAQGSRVVVVASNLTAPLAQAAGFPVLVLSRSLGRLCRLAVECCVNDDPPRAIILCDHYSCSIFFRKLGVDPGFLQELGPPLISMDIWDCTQARIQVDAFGKPRAAKPDGLGRVAGRIVPVPIGRTSTKGGYCCLPDPRSLRLEGRAETRAKYGIGIHEKTVLFCTGSWQHDVHDGDGRRLAREVPNLLCALLARADPAIRLIHVGPVSLKLDSLFPRFTWVPSALPDEFDHLLASVDLLLSANVAATTIGRAMVAGIPVLVVTNSFEAADYDALENIVPFFVSPLVRRWLKTATPLYPFSMWPLGYQAFLKPLLLRNSYTLAFEIVELLDEDGFVDVCRQLLYASCRRATALARQDAYIDEVRRLPSADQLIASYLK